MTEVFVGQPLASPGILTMIVIKKKGRKICNSTTLSYTMDTTLFCEDGHHARMDMRSAITFTIANLQQSSVSLFKILLLKISKNFYPKKGKIMKTIFFFT